METLQEAYSDGQEEQRAPGIDGVTFEAIEAAGVEHFLSRFGTNWSPARTGPCGTGRRRFPKEMAKSSVLGIPTIRDRVVQGALKLILEPIFEADFQEGSYGYRPKRTAHQAVQRVAEAIVQNKTQVIDLDLKAYFDTVRHDLLLEKVAQRVNDDQVLHLLKLILKAGGKRGRPARRGDLTACSANLYLNEVDKMLERAKEVTRRGRYTYIEYARFADDLVILVDGHRRWDWLVQGSASDDCWRNLAKLDVQINEEKTRIVDLTQGGKLRVPWL